MNSGLMLSPVCPSRGWISRKRIGWSQDYAIFTIR